MAVPGIITYIEGDYLVSEVPPELIASFIRAQLSSLKPPKGLEDIRIVKVEGGKVLIELDAVSFLKSLGIEAEAKGDRIVIRVKALPKG